MLFSSSVGADWYCLDSILQVARDDQYYSFLYQDLCVSEETLLIQLGPQNIDLVCWLFWVKRPFDTVFQSISGRLSKEREKEKR